MFTRDSSSLNGKVVKGSQEECGEAMLISL